ncbi:hypothetical protein L9F63_004841 [Diploptera punctata]|uniref:Uncharacterized protein n=1 Tax=Diploptera punctata TaxID=6984 RepID=A0AAD8E706_DIPPU|nr:hypothetical protein L9F63_004841 [Diploptera punctata]
MANCGGITILAVMVIMVSHKLAAAFQDCHNINSQHSLDLDQIMGDWYAVEIVRHNRIVEKNTISTVLDVCPVLRLIRDDNTTIRLFWNEKKGDLIYKFQQPKATHAGFWNCVGPQNGTLAKLMKKPFSGTVQVMKAVSSHMVLTFCSRTDDEIYSVLMSRNRKLQHNDVKSVNSMLERRGLPRGHVEEMCKGSAAPTANSMGCLATTTVLTASLLMQFVSNLRY